MKENSPICARESPTTIESRSGYFNILPTPTITRTLPATMQATSTRSHGRLLTKYCMLRSMPMEMKKRAEKVSRNGTTSATIWLLYSLSDMASPAMKAPSASESPKREVNHAVPMQTRAMERMNTSLFLSFTIWLKKRGIMYITATTMAAKAKSEKASPFDISKTEAPLLPPMDWTSMTISTTQRS